MLLLGLQVLSSVKHKVDAYAYTVDGFETRMSKARQFLAWRESPESRGAAPQGRLRSDSNLSVVPASLKGALVVLL